MARNGCSDQPVDEPNRQLAGENVSYREQQITVSLTSRLNGAPPANYLAALAGLDSPEHTPNSITPPTPTELRAARERVSDWLAKGCYTWGVGSDPADKTG